MFSLFFIRRPIFACVVAILITLAGVAAYQTLPVAEYPEITPPVIRVTATYPGANAKVLNDTVAQTIEQEVNGVEHMIYMSSTANSDGSYSLDVTFDLGTDVDLASVLVQNRVASALPRLPEEVQRQGVVTRKQSTSIVLVLGIAPEKEEDSAQFNDTYLSNFVNQVVRDELLRVPGVGDVNVLPAKDYSMRVWLDPNKLKARGLTTTDIVDSMREQNVQVAAGQVGQPPAPSGQNFQYILTTLGRLETVEQFKNIIIKTAAGGRVMRLSEVADVELGAQNYGSGSRLNGKPSATVIIFQQPGSNAVDIATNAKDMLKRLKAEGRMPAGIEAYDIYNVAEFVKTSVKEVYKTLFEAILLVVVVVLVFLGSWRATLIPLITIPVALIGTFFIMKGFGFSINLLTLFGLILAIGIVVDDAIVVVENVERNMAVHHLQPREATIRGMGEVFAPIVAISLVLMSVFGPAALLGGITGQLFRQFALTIAASTALSALNALSLSPALSAILLRAHVPGKKQNFFNRGFNVVFGAVTSLYRAVVTWLIHLWPISLAAFATVLWLTSYLYAKVPVGFLPQEDNGFYVTNIQLPDAASLERTTDVVQRAVKIMAGAEGTSYATGLPGFSVIAGTGSNVATAFATLKPWDERLPKGRDIKTIRNEVSKQLFGIPEAFIFTFEFPPIPGLGSSAGFDMRLLADANVPREQLEQVSFALLGNARQDPKLANVFNSYRAGVPQYFVDVDREKVKRLGVPLQRVFDTLQSSMGAQYVNDFNKFGRTYQVNVQAGSAFRATPEDVLKLQVRNADGGMVPLGSIATITPSYGPERINRYNLFDSSSFSGEGAPGVSTDDAMNEMARLFEQVKQPGIRYDWSSTSYQQKKTAGQATVVFTAGIIVVYLILAALYESWSLPLAVALAIPIAAIGAVLFLLARGFDNNLYTQIGLVLLVGLAAKNAILIVEFAVDARKEGKNLHDAAVEAAVTRFRPILMTSFAFILGCLPLMLATGAGANSRQAIGTAVVGGMLGATALGVLFIPVLYYVVQGATENLQRLVGRDPRRNENIEKAPTV